MVPDWREGVSICRSARTATWTVNVNERGEINKRRRSFHADGGKLPEWQTVLWQDAGPLLKAALGGRSKTLQGATTPTLRRREKNIKWEKKKKFGYVSRHLLPFHADFHVGQQAAAPTRRPTCSCAAASGFDFVWLWRVGIARDGRIPEKYHST